jgi:nitrite reductase/ring-hydroxylating ferredoxin subunit
MQELPWHNDKYKKVLGRMLSDVFLCKSEDVPTETGLRVEDNISRPLAVWRRGDQIFITDDICTHGQASLVEDGLLEGFNIECGLHQGSFDIRTGEVTSAPCRIPLRTYAPVIKGDSVFVSSHELTK